MDIISSRQNPIVRACRELADTPDAAGARILLDGVHLVRDADAAGYEFELVAVAASRLSTDTEEGKLAARLDMHGCPVFAVNDKAFAAMSPVRTPSGILAIARRTPSDLRALYGRADGFIVVVVDVQDPGNLGAVIRAAEAGGATAALVCGASAHPFSWKALRGSMGSALRLPIAAVPDAALCVRELRDAGVRTIASAPRDGLDPDALAWTRPCALVIGGEGTGLRDVVRTSCDEHVTIPMAAPVESLNVAVAAAVLIYAARRQRLHGASRNDDPKAVFGTTSAPSKDRT